jgi:hypothetical protein
MIVLVLIPVVGLMVLMPLAVLHPLLRLMALLPLSPLAPLLLLLPLPGLLALMALTPLMEHEVNFHSLAASSKPPTPSLKISAAEAPSMRVGSRSLLRVRFAESIPRQTFRPRTPHRFRRQ